MITHYNTKPGKSVLWTLPLIKQGYHVEYGEASTCRYSKCGKPIMTGQFGNKRYCNENCKKKAQLENSTIYISDENLKAFRKWLDDNGYSTYNTVSKASAFKVSIGTSFKSVTIVGKNQYRLMNGLSGLYDRFGSA